jgi:hypothetical protein
MLKRYSISITRTWCAVLLALSCASLHAQVDTTGGAGGDEDYSQYDNVGFADDGAKRFCSPKIEGLSPAKLISVGYDYQLGYQMIADSLRSQSPFAPWGNFNPDTGEVAFSHGLRLACNIPVVSKTSLVWQLGANYWEQQYEFKDDNSLSNPMLTALRDNGLRTMGISTTVFKPLNDKQFLLFQGSVDMSGDFQLSKLMPARYLKYSAAAIWGKRPTERKQWGIGVSRTYRVGELNYIPIVLFNWTDASNKWGTEILFPARAHVRRTINSRNMVFAGYELEGQSYRFYRNNDPSANFDMRREDLEIRRGEIRLRLMYEFSLKGFVWMSVQAGYRINYRYDVDRLTDGTEIYRGFGLVSDAPYVMVNQLTNPLYFNISLNLVSP